MITENKVIEIFCIMDEFCRNFASECEKNLLLEDNSFFENKPEALPVHVEKSNQLTLF